MQIEAWYYRNDDHSQNADQNKHKVGIIHFAVICDDINKTKSQFDKIGIKFYKDLKTIDLNDTPLSLFYVEDPSGILIEFIEKPKYKK